MVTTAKQPIQIRLSDTELARLDAYRSTIGRFPPDRPAVVKTALLDWLDWQETGAPTEHPTIDIINCGSASPQPDPSMEGGTPTLADVAPDTEAAERERERKRINSQAYRQRERDKKAKA